MCEIAPDAIRVSPFQPRRLFAEEELKELSTSILQIGLIQPPVVRKIMQNGKILYYELIAGERRWRAAMLAGLKSISVLVRSSSDNQAAEASLIENIQRVDLNPIEMAEAFQKLIEIFRLTQEEIADKVGKKRSTVANYLRLLALPNDIRTGIQTGIITMGHAKAILSLTDSDMKSALYELIQKNKLTVREAEKESMKLVKVNKKKKDRDQEEHARDLESSLEKHFQTKVRITSQGKKGGKIALHYHSLDDLDRLLSLFSLEL